MNIQIIINIMLIINMITISIFLYIWGSIRVKKLIIYFKKTKEIKEFDNFDQKVAMFSHKIKPLYKKDNPLVVLGAFILTVDVLSDIIQNASKSHNRFNRINTDILRLKDAGNSIYDFTKTTYLAFAENQKKQGQKHEQ